MADINTHMPTTKKKKGVGKRDFIYQGLFFERDSFFPCHDFYAWDISVCFELRAFLFFAAVLKKFFSLFCFAGAVRFPLELRCLSPHA